MTNKEIDYAPNTQQDDWRNWIGSEGRMTKRMITAMKSPKTAIQVYDFIKIVMRILVKILKPL